jgi:hypothetical protein
LTQGRFPDLNLAHDGCNTTCPVWYCLHLLSQEMLLRHLHQQL